MSARGMNVFKFSIPTLICITCIVSSVAPHDSPDSPVLVKFSKSFYQNHDLDTISKGTDTTISPNSLADSSHEVSNEVDCHRAAVSRCGHILIRVFKFLDYLNARESFQPRCAFREAFFKCMKVSKEKFCYRRKRGYDHAKFRERLAKTLWSTRTCILGSMDYYY